MVGSPGVLIVLRAAQAPLLSAGYRTSWASDRKMKSFSASANREEQRWGESTSHSQYWSILFQIFRLVSRPEQIWQHLPLMETSKNPEDTFKSFHYLFSILQHDHLRFTSFHNFKFHTSNITWTTGPRERNNAYDLMHSPGIHREYTL